MMDIVTRGPRKPFRATLFLLCLLTAALVTAEDASDSAKEPPEPPKVRLVSAHDVGQLIKDGRGKVLVVNFWATWCPPCVEEMPELVAFYRNYAHGSVEFLSISADHPSTVDDRVRPFIEEKRLPFPVHVMKVKGPDELNDVLNLDWDGALPATFVFGRDGRAVHSWIGAITLADLKRVVDPLVTPRAQETPASPEHPIDPWGKAPNPGRPSKDMPTSATPHRALPQLQRPIPAPRDTAHTRPSALPRS